MANLIFEIGCEELPANFIRLGLEMMKRIILTDLSSLSLNFEKVHVTGTPRRLALFIEGLAEKQSDQEEIIYGPPVKVAFDSQDNPNKAALSFANSHNIKVEELKRHSMAKGDRLVVKRKIFGKTSHELLEKLLPLLIEKISFPKMMCWNSRNYKFARPIRWLLAVLDGKLISFKAMGLNSKNETRGHRFLSPFRIQINSSNEYIEKLEKAYVIVDRDRRKEIIKIEVEQIVDNLNAKLVKDDELLNEVTDLVEFPVVCCGSFDKEFLKIPKKIIINVMKKHQKYFSLEDHRHKLLNKFIAINNTKPKEISTVISGHERVIKARLSDITFFLKEDLKYPLIDRLELLKKITYHEKLGSLFSKVMRLKKISKIIMKNIGSDKLYEIERAALLSKCDLTTEMVKEFPNLQGVIGEEYASKSGERTVIAEAIKNHYLPLNSESKLPNDTVGACLGLADRLDNVCGMFILEEVPSGSADPFGLRRAVIGIIRIVLEKKFYFPLGDILKKALVVFQESFDFSLDLVRKKITDFFKKRSRIFFIEKRGISSDIVDSVLAVSLNNFISIEKRMLALKEFKKYSEFESLLTSVKRITNILKKQEKIKCSIDTSFMKHSSERNLYQIFQELNQRKIIYLKKEDYRSFLKSLCLFKDPIDSFFDKVLIMDPDEKLRKNKLSLLMVIRNFLREFAYFEYLT